MVRENVSCVFISCKFILRVDLQLYILYFSVVANHGKVAHDSKVYRDITF